MVVDCDLSLPPPLDGVPTDAEVALEIISRRVAQGLPVLPQKRRKARSATVTSLPPGSPGPDSPSIRSVGDEEKKFSWSKLADRVAEGKNLADSAKRLVSNQTVSPLQGPCVYVASYTPL